MLLPTTLTAVLPLLLLASGAHGAKKIDFQNQGGIASEEDLEAEERDGPHGKDVFDFLYSRLNQEVLPKKKLPANVYKIPGPQEPLPGRTHMGDYWPVFPFQNQYSGGLDLDPSISRHIGGDLNVAVPSWGMMDIYGRLYSRIQDTTTKVGYLNHPVNMMDLEKEDFVKLMGDPAMAHNRMAHPTLPMARIPKRFTPMSCKPPMCNPYHMNLAMGIEHKYGGVDGVEGDIDVPMPVSKGIAYRFPFSGNIYYNTDNMTITYGQNLAPIEPFSSLFDYQKHRDPALAIPRRWTRSIPEPMPEMLQKHPVEGRMGYGMVERYPSRIVPMEMPNVRRQLQNNYRFIDPRYMIMQPPQGVPAMMPLFNTLPLHDAYNIYPNFARPAPPIMFIRRPRRSRRVLMPYFF